MSYRRLSCKKLQVKILPQKLKNLTLKATNPTPNQHQLYTMPSLSVGRSEYLRAENKFYLAWKHHEIISKHDG